MDAPGIAPGPLDFQSSALLIELCVQAIELSEIECAVSAVHLARAPPITESRACAVIRSSVFLSSPELSSYGLCGQNFERTDRIERQRIDLKHLPSLQESNRP